MINLSDNYSWKPNWNFFQRTYIFQGAQHVLTEHQSVSTKVPHFLSRFGEKENTTTNETHIYIFNAPLQAVFGNVQDF